ncbi:hypothetical protein LBMAG42_45060 [Deltaproteobacteria bacterium]|nr:hypothetical protein LBMAG42_45060 [Deltaproteobacteria bacterium]
MPTRRDFLGVLTIPAVACISGTNGAGDPASGEIDETDDTPIDAITSNADFYKVAISGFLPDEAWLAAWTLTIRDDDGNEVTLTLADILAIGGAEQERTLACIGGGSSRTTSNAMWTAIRLDALLEALGLNPDARLQWVRFTSGDGYSTSVPRSDLAAGLALATGMNGVPLPADHGAPLRALVPNRYGMKNPKWITRIDFVEAFEEGFWEARGWSQDAEYLVQSWFRAPSYGATVSAAGAWINGTAFAGEAGITKVELTDDDGKTWQTADITYPGGPGVWTLWQLFWVPPAPGDYTLRIRATAADGRVQADLEPYDLDLDGLEAFDTILVIAE